MHKPRASGLGRTHLLHSAGFQLGQQAFVASARSMEHANERAHVERSTRVTRRTTVTCYDHSSGCEKFQLLVEPLPVPQDTATTRCKEHTSRPIID
jgi:hypothetical protein